MKSTFEPPKIVILTGPRGDGKTTWILGLWEYLRQNGEAVFGVATPKIFTGPRMMGIAVRDLATGQERPLALRDSAPGKRYGPWRFLPKGIEMANEATDPKDHAGLAIIDEIGPLELQGDGFVTAFNALCEGRYKRAVVVIRGDLLKKIGLQIKGKIKVIKLDTAPGYPKIVSALKA